jgi:hypothetical protein
MAAIKLTEPRPRSGRIADPTKIKCDGVLWLDRKLSKQSSPLEILLHRRKSVRKFHRATRDNLARLLELMQGEGGVVGHQHRNWPSPGSLHGVRIAVLNFPGHPADAFVYLPDAHALGHVATGPGVRAAVRAFNSVVPVGGGTLLWFLADVRRYVSKYHNPESLILKEAGVLTAGAYLAAAQLGLGCCAVGRNGSREIWCLGKDFSEFAPVGACIVGAR